MKPLYSTLKSKHSSSNELNLSYLDKKKLYEEIGYDIDNLVKQNPGYENTCAIRMSLALIKAGISFTGRLQVKSGQYKGRTIEPGAKLLAD